MEQNSEQNFGCPQSRLFKATERENSCTLEEAIDDLLDARLSSRFDQFDYYKLIDLNGNFTFWVGVEDTIVDKIKVSPADYTSDTEVQYLSREETIVFFKIKM